MASPAPPNAIPSVTHSEPCVVFVSVANDLRYNRHIASILALPEGFVYKCRYPKRWVHPDVPVEKLKPWIASRPWMKTILQYAPTLAKLIPKSAFGLQGLFVAVTTDSNGRDLFLPIRPFTIVDVHDYGKIIFFEIELGNLLDFQAQQKTANELSELIRNSTYRDSTHAKLQKEVFFLPERPWPLPLCHCKTPEERRRAWASAAEIFVDHNILGGVSFLQANFRRLGNSKCLRPQRISAEQVGIRIRPGLSYVVDVFQYRPSTPPRSALDPLGIAIEAFIDRAGASDISVAPTLVSMECDEAVLQVVKRDEVIDGDFDRFQLIFRPSSRSINERTIIRIRDTQEVADVTMPIIEIPVWIKNSLLRAVTNYLVLVLGVVGFIVPSAFQSLSASLAPLVPDSVLYRIPKYQPLPDSTVQALSVIGLLMVLANWSLSSFVQELKSTLKFR